MPPADVQTSVAALEKWLAQQQRVAHINRFGGSYWFYATVRNDSNVTRWVIEPHSGLTEYAQVYVYLPGMAAQSFTTGYHTDNPYMLHYGGDVTLPQGATAQVLLRIESRYFTHPLSIFVSTQASYRKTVITENVWILSALGAMLTLALYNLFIFIGIRDRSLLYYALYLLAAVVAWGSLFNIPAQWLGWRDLRWSFVAFLLMVVFNTLFYLEFLQLRRHAPRLARLSRYTILLALVLLPISFLVLPYASTIVTAVVSFSLILALWAGVIRLSQGYHPARYFLAAFVALLIPSLLVLPYNLRLVEHAVRMDRLLALIGSAADAILLAFALADKIRLLARKKDDYLAQLNRALGQASTDHLTGIANRFAFDHALGALSADAAQQVMLVIIDLDGLKRINDEHGHAYGDALLREFARQLQTLSSTGMSVFRLGGDEFSVIGQAHDEDMVRQAMLRFEGELRAAGFTDCGISYGIAFGTEGASGSQLLTHADTRMYLHKTSKRSSPPER